MKRHEVIKKETYLEPEVGEVFEYRGLMVRCELGVDITCRGCVLFDGCEDYCSGIYCIGVRRSDRTNVIFKEVKE